MQALPMEKCGPVFSLLLPEKSAILSMQLRRLRLTQTLQYLLKKRMKKRLCISISPESLFSPCYWYNLSGYWGKTVYLPDTE